MATAIDRRSFLARSAATAGGVVAAGAMTDAAMATQAGATTFSGTLKVGIENQDTGGIGPAWGKMDSAGFAMMRAIYDPLMVNTSTGAVVPYLAQSMTPDSKFINWTIKLRSGIKFHDGTDLNADVLIANMNGWVNSNAIAHYAVAPLVQNKTTKLATTTKIDNLTVKLTLNYAWASFPNTLAEQQIAYVQSAACVAANVASNNSGDKSPVGTGPFKFNRCDWGVNSVMYADANENYWIPGLPNVAHIEFHPIVDGGARVDALGSSVDMVVLSEPKAIAALKSNFGAASSSSSHYIDDSSAAGYAVRTPAVDSIQFNCRNALGYKGSPFSNYLANGHANPKGLLARKAVAEAIDRSALNTLVNGGITQVANQVFPPSSVYGTSTVAFPAYSATKAKADAKSAGLTSFKLQTVAGSTSQATAAAAIQSYCAAAGITVTIVTLDSSTLINNCLVGAYDASLWNQFGGWNPDLNFPWWNTLDGSNGAFVSINMAGNFDSVIQNTMLAAMAAGAPHTQASKWKAVMSQINKDIPYVWIDYQVSAIASTTNVSGWQSPSWSVGGSTVNLLRQNGLVPWFTNVTIS